MRRLGMRCLQSSRDAARCWLVSFPRWGRVSLQAPRMTIPIMSASAAYAAGEIFGWRVGINKSFRTARAFYAIIIVSTLVGIAIDFANINAIKALFWSAVLNGLLAPFLLAAILIVATDRKLMRNHPAPLVATVLVAIATCAMIGAALGMFLL
jgi:Mn2+/Fe2+ NRAMP family transporter